jgi:prepilin-type N-terminal cleavage/methylation domain-containing protein
MRASRTGKSGFTLVELMVAAILILVAVAAVVGVVRKSTDMQINDYHRRQARAMIMEHFEAAFNQFRFKVADEADYYSVTVERPDALDGDTTFTVPILAASVTNPAFTPPNGTRFLINDISNIPALVSFRAQRSQQDITLPGASRTVDYHNITIRATWTEVGGTRDSVILTKRLAAIHD